MVFSFWTFSTGMSMRLISAPVNGTVFVVIRTFRHRGLKRLFHGDASKVRADQVRRIADVLGHLDAAEHPSDLDLPGYRLHRLKGDMKGMWSITISGAWRIVFRFVDGDAFDIDLVDYH
jgi:proteic killer suppression protein